MIQPSFKLLGLHPRPPVLSSNIPSMAPKALVDIPHARLHNYSSITLYIPEPVGFYSHFNMPHTLD